MADGKFVISMNREEHSVGVYCPLCDTSIPRPLLQLFASAVNPQILPEDYKAEDLLGIGYNFLCAHCMSHHDISEADFNKRACQIIDENMLLDGKGFSHDDWTDDNDA